MDATAVIAIYAAAVATVGLFWQVYTWQHRRKSHIAVEARFGFMVPDTSIEIITITATNQSEHPVRVGGLGIDLQDGSGRFIPVIHCVSGSTLPGTIAPHDSGQAIVEHDPVKDAGIDVSEPLTVWATLATGETVKSKPSRLIRR